MMNTIKKLLSFLKSEAKPINNRRGFLKTAASVPLAIALVPEEKIFIANSKNLTDLEKAKVIDTDITSPFLYVRAIEDIKQGELVNSGKEPYSVEKGDTYRNQWIGIATNDIPKNTYGFIQTVGHLPVGKKYV